MNNLILHIEYLLQRHDCVIVPGLGAFIATEIPAKIDMEKGVMVPPGRSVMFNQAVTTDDGLLTNSIVRREGLSFEEGRQVLFREVSIIKNELNLRGSFSVGKIGTLLIGESNTLLFVPSDSSDSLSVFPGLKEICVEISKEKNGYSSERNPKFKFIKSIGKIAAVVIVTAAIAIATLLYPMPSDQREQKASVVPVEALFSKQGNNDVPKESLVTNLSNPRATDSVTSETKPTYYLIVATFNSSKEAETYAARYSTPEYPLMTVSTNKVTRVTVASSDNKEDLQQRLNSKEVRSRFSNPWIWKKI